MIAVLMIQAVTSAIKFAAPFIKSGINHVKSRDGKGDIEFTVTDALLFTKADVEELKEKGAWGAVERAEMLYSANAAAQRAAKYMQKRG